MSAGPEPPFVNVVEQNNHDFASTETAHEAFDADSHTSGIFVRAFPNNDEFIYIGWSEDVSPDNGIPLAPGEGLSFNIDNFHEPLHIIATEIGDSVSYVAMD